MRKTLLVLALLGAVGFGSWRFLAPAPAVKSPLERLKVANPVEAVRAPRRPATTVAREVPAAAIPPKFEAQRAQMEERFNDLKEEGRRVRQALIDSDPKAAQAYSAISAGPEYRALLDRRHQIEAAWAAAPEGEREAMLTEMNSLRQQGFTLILAEIQRVRSQPEAAPLQRIAPSQDTPGVATPAAAPAASPPVVFQ